LLPEFVAVTGAFEFARFDAAGAVGDFALGDLLQQLLAAGFKLVGREVAARKPRPRCPHLLAGGSEADLARLLLVQQGGSGGADEVVVR